MLGLSADRAGWSTDHHLGRQQGTLRDEEGDLPNRHTPGASVGRS